MEYVIICLVAFVVSVITFFSGFGLGTLLMPVFALFFPLETAIALTGIVHLSSNLFRVGLIWKQVDWNIVLRFGLPAIIAAFIGAWLLLQLSGLSVLWSYRLTSNHVFYITPIKLIIAILLLLFVVSEFMPFFKKLNFGKHNMLIGGVLSGFFGGLTGIQGALRSAFLIRSGLSKEGYIAVSVIISCFVDITRLSVYAGKFVSSGLSDNLTLVVSATFAAIAGSFIGAKILKKITIKFIQIVVSTMLICVSIAMGIGLI